MARGDRVCVLAVVLELVEVVEERATAASATAAGLTTIRIDDLDLDEDADGEEETVSGDDEGDVPSTPGGGVRSSSNLLCLTPLLELAS